MCMRAATLTALAPQSPSGGQTGKGRLLGSGKSDELDSSRPTSLA